MWRASYLTNMDIILSYHIYFYFRSFYLCIQVGWCIYSTWDGSRVLVCIFHETTKFHIFVSCSYDLLTLNITKIYLESSYSVYYILYDRNIYILYDRQVNLFIFRWRFFLQIYFFLVFPDKVNSIYKQHLPKEIEQIIFGDIFHEH